MSLGMDGQSDIAAYVILRIFPTPRCSSWCRLYLECGGPGTWSNISIPPTPPCFSLHYSETSRGGVTVAHRSAILLPSKRHSTKP